MVAGVSKQSSSVGWFPKNILVRVAKPWVLFENPGFPSWPCEFLGFCWLGYVYIYTYKYYVQYNLLCICLCARVSMHKWFVLNYKGSLFIYIYIYIRIYMYMYSPHLHRKILIFSAQETVEESLSWSDTGGCGGWSARIWGQCGALLWTLGDGMMERPMGWWRYHQYTLWLCQNSYWKWPFIVSFPIKNGDFP